MSEKRKDSGTPKRDGDAPGFDPKTVREDPLAITLDQHELRAAIGTSRRESFIRGLIAGVVAAIIVAAIIGIVETRAITNTVRHDVGRAAVFNCNRTNRSASVGPALRRFLTTDAAFNAKLATLDRRSASIDRDLSRQVQKLGPLLPPQIAKDYFAQSDVFQQLAAKRAQVASLWAGDRITRKGTVTKGRAPSLAGAILLLTQAPCDKILLP